MSKNYVAMPIIHYSFFVIIFQNAIANVKNEA